MKIKKIFRKAVFIVTYKIDSKNLKPQYLVLHRYKHWKGWEFPKGGIDSGENAIQTVKREVKEESGLKIIKIKRFNIKGSYKYPKILKDRPHIKGQTYTLFSAQVKEGKINIDKKEHSCYLWLPFEKAVKKLTWSNQKRCLRIVEKSIYSFSYINI